MQHCMNFIILGDKFQKRMKSRGCVGLIKLNNKAILQHQYKTIKAAFPSANIIYVYGFESKKFINFISKITPPIDIIPIHNSSFDEYNNAYSLSLVTEYLNDNCCIIFGDNILGPQLFQKFDINNGSQVFINKKNKSRLGCIINDNRVENISYDLDNYLCDIYYLNKNHAQLLKKFISNNRYHNYFLFELINKIIDHSEIIKPFFINSKHNSLSSYKVI